MRRTFAYNGIIIGILVGLLIGVAAKSAAVMIIAMIGISILAFAIIRLFENAVSAGVDKAASAIEDKINERKNNR